jgi:hypothetical protein
MVTMGEEKERLISAVSTYARFTVICVCVITLILASTVGFLVHNHSLAYSIACELYDDVKKIEYSCGSMKCTEEIVRNNQCIICTEELLTGPGQSCHDERVDESVITDTQTIGQITEDPKGCMGPYYDKTIDEDGNPIPIYCSEKPVGYNCISNNPNVDFLRFVCCPKGWDYKENPPDAKCVPISRS